MRSTHWLLGLVSLTTVSTTAQVVAEQAVQLPKVTIRGRVVDSVTGAGVAGALIAHGDRFTYAAYNGEFTLGDSTDRYNLRIAHPKYETHYWSAEKPGEGADVLIKLVPFAAVTGQVLDTFGEPIPYVTVQLLSEQVSEGVRHTSVVREHRTDDRGVYRLWDVRPETYLLRALGRTGEVRIQGRLPAGVQPTPPGGSERYGPAYYPGSPGRKGAAVLQVAAGAEVHADFTLATEPAYTVTGRVAGHKAGASLKLELYRDGRDLVGVSARINRDSGTFVLDDVAAGNYVLRATSDNNTRLFGERTLTVTRSLAEADIDVSAGATVEVSVNADPACAGARISLRQTGHAWDQSSYYMDRTNSRIDRPLGPGVYRVLSYGGCYLSSARTEATDVLAEGLTVGANSLIHLEVVLKEGGGRLQFEPNSNKGKEEQTRIAMVRDDPAGGIAYEFDLVSLPQFGERLSKPQKFAPGSYLVWAWQGPGKVAYWDPEEREAWRDRATRVTVRDGAAETVKVRLLTETKP